MPNDLINGFALECLLHAFLSLCVCEGRACVIAALGNNEKHEASIKKKSTSIVLPIREPARRHR